MPQPRGLAEHVLRLLSGRGAHVEAERVLDGWPACAVGERPEGFEHSAWQLLEHLRIAQWDILEYSRRAEYVSPEWPGGYWPASAEPPDGAAWERSRTGFFADLEAMRGLVREGADALLEPLPHLGEDGPTLLKEALLVADHNAYHLGQLVVLKRRLGAWPD